MHTIIYKFIPKNGHREDFVKSWKAVTENIYRERGSLGSRLHSTSGVEIIAYAQWPNRAQTSLDLELSDRYKEDLKIMLSYLETSEVLYELDVSEDLLQTESYS
jgi:quinol monooxygenase YgiN